MKAIAFGALLALTVHQASAASCDLTVAEVIRLTGAEFIRYSPSGENAFLRHPQAASLLVSCGVSKSPTTLSVTWGNALPPTGFFSTAGAAGAAVTSETPARIEAAARQCYRTALASRTSELSEREAGKATVQCHASSRDGGGVTLVIRPPG